MWIFTLNHVYIKICTVKSADFSVEIHNAQSSKLKEE